MSWHEAFHYRAYHWRRHIRSTNKEIFPERRLRATTRPSYIPPPCVAQERDLYDVTYKVKTMTGCHQLLFLRGKLRGVFADTFSNIFLGLLSVP